MSSKEKTPEYDCTGFFTEFSLEACSATHKGRVRAVNEDAVVFLPEKGFFAVADGMGGGLAGGETAKAVACLMPSVIERIQHALPRDAAPSRVGKQFRRKLKKVSDSISEKGNKGFGLIYGTTFSATWFVGNSVVIVNIGDSRVYILRDNQHLRQITKDHTVINILLKSGEITSEEAVSHPARGQLTRYIGMPPPALPDIHIKTIEPGDRILLCSDGLTSMLSNQEIVHLLKTDCTPEDICNMLIIKANGNGGKDNTSVIVIDVDSNKENKNNR
jgi:PPM family protein phosphatase